MVFAVASVLCFSLLLFVGWTLRAQHARRDRGLALARNPSLRGYARVTLQAAPLFYVPVDVADDIARGGKRRALAKVVDGFFRRDPRRRCLLLLGDAGLGKTTFLLDYVSRAASAVNVSGKVLVLALSHPDSLDEIRAVEPGERERTALILDGLDAHPGASVNPEAALCELFALCVGFRRVILSARSELFPDASLIPDRIAVERPGQSEDPETAAADDDVRVEAVHLLPPSDAQIQKYLERRYPFALHRRWAARRLVTRSEVLRNSRLMLAHLEDFLGTAQANAPGSMPNALELVMETWLVRERATAPREPLRSFTRALSLATFRRARDGKHGLVPREAIHAEAPTQVLETPKNTDDPRAVVLGDGEDRFAFAHALLFEYALAEALFALSAEKRRSYLGARVTNFPSTSKRVALERFIKPGADLSSWDLTDSDLRGADLTGANLAQARLSGADLGGARLIRASLVDSALDRTNLAEADLSEADLSGADLVGADLSGANLDNSKLDRADLNGTMLRETSMRGATLRSTELDGRALQSFAPPGAEVEERTIKEPVAGVRFSWVPGGRFRMGNDKELAESPAHWVRVSSFWLGQTPVTNRQYAVFLEQSGHREPEGLHDERFADPEQPAVGISFDDAVAFCSWLTEASGLSITLPSEAQWEYAARGPEGREFPWGDDEPDASRARYAEDVLSGGPAKVGSYPPGRGPFGTLDQAGNVWEWCLDSWDGMAYLKRAGKELVDPDVLDGKPGMKPVRGGSWFSPPEDLRATLRGRNEATRRDEDQGFRVAIG